MKCHVILYGINMINNQIQIKKQQLDQYKPFPKSVISNMNEWFKIELTYTSNAIEGNTLTRQETALIIDKGITVEGKSITEHQEAINHAHAFEYIQNLVNNKDKKITEQDILTIHSIILKNIDNENAGRYRSVPVRIAGSRAVMPNPLRVPKFVGEFFLWLSKPVNNIIRTAFDAHFKFVSIHPFTDGNGRCARLLMNLILMQNGYPPSIIQKENRKKYISVIEKGQLTGDLNDYYFFMEQSLEQTIDIFLQTFESKEKIKIAPKKLLRIGELAKTTNTTVATIRFWTKQGLLSVAELSKGGYQLYSLSSVKRVIKIKKLQKEKRLTIAELIKIKITS